jgi:enolase-phosphatase E1
VSVSLSATGTRAVVLDIEGTTTPIAFVYDVLFPFARAHAKEYLEREWTSGPCRAAVALLREEHAADVSHNQGPPAWVDEPHTAQVASVAAYVGWLMDRDRKSSGLKALQGEIWRSGYRSGELRGQVFPDVPPALARWRAQQLAVCIYSSGSVLAQQLLFQTTGAGDLTRFLTGHFDTGIGPKASPDSYRHIAEALAAPAERLLFISDVTGELDAARAAGLQTLLCVRSSNPTTAPEHSHPVIHTFDDIVG